MIDDPKLESKRSESGDDPIDLHRVVDHLPALVSYVDAQQRYRYANARYREWHGLGSESLVGRHVRDVVGPASFASIRPYLERALAGELVRYELSHSFPGRGRRWLTVCYVPNVVDGEVAGTFALVTDITDTKGVEQELRDSEERHRALLRAVVDTAADGVITTDKFGTVEAINPAAERIFGYSAEEVLGNNVTMLMPPPFSEEHDDHLARYLKTGETKIIGTGREVVGRRRDGSTFPMEVSVSEFRWDGSVAFAGIVRDITARKRLEAEFLQAQKMEAVGRLAGGIAHDFNNLLMGIIGCCRVAAQQVGDTHAARAVIDDIGAEAERAAGLTRQLLAFARKRRIDPRPIELNRVVENARSMIGHLVGEDIEICVELSPSGGPIVADPAQIEQVLMNLVVNARDAMPQGGRLTIETLDMDSHVSERFPGLMPGRYVALAVEDTGVGMDEETKAKMFEPFFTTKRPGEGTGLGLSTVYALVERLGGRVGVDSAPGKGARFTVLIPRDEVESVADCGQEPDAVASGGEETILVVEDEGLVRSSLRYGLESRGYRVLDAKNAADALQACREREWCIDLLLTDIVLPGMSGPELAREVEANNPEIGTLFMSAYPVDYLVEQGRLSEGQISLEKPFTEEELACRVREVLDARSRR